MTRRTRRRIRVSRPVPAPSKDEPSDEEILRYLDGAMAPEERMTFEARLQKSPYAEARIELLSAALEENGWAVHDEPGPRRGSA